MFLLVVIAIVVIICVISKSNSSTSNTAPLHPPVQKKVLIDTDLVNSVIAIQETAINIARSNRCGGFLRISVFSNKGQAGIELDHFYHTNKPNSYLDNTEFVMFYAARPAESEKLIRTQTFLKDFGCTYSDWDRIIPYFSDMNLSVSGPEGIYARKQIQIPVELAPHYFSAILSIIREKWPYLQIDVDQEYGDIDFHISNK